MSDRIVEQHGTILRCWLEGGAAKVREALLPLGWSDSDVSDVVSLLELERLLPDSPVSMKKELDRYKAHPNEVIKLMWQILDGMLAISRAGTEDEIVAILLERQARESKGIPSLSADELREMVRDARWPR